MVRIHFMGGDDMVVEVADMASLPARLADPNGVLSVTFDGHPVLVAVRAIAAIVQMH